MVCNICVLYEPITIHYTGQAGHGRGDVLEGHCCDSTLLIYECLNYLSMSGLSGIQTQGLQI